MPVVVVAKIGNALRLTAVDDAASARGLRPGMALADARAAVPGVAVAEADPPADHAMMEAIADWCDRYTPLVALDLSSTDAAGSEPDIGPGLFLDITGCAHLFGGEQKLRADLLRRLASQGFVAQAAIASTAGTAWALTRFGTPDVQAAWVAPGAEASVLADLPVAALRLDAGQKALLERLGLKRIGQLVGQPRAPLATRFGIGLVRRLDQALGVEDEPLSPRLPAPMFSAERRFPEPIVTAPAIHATIRSLAEALSPRLVRHGVGARYLELRLYRVDGGVPRAGVGTARPVREADAIARLFAERLAGLGESFETALDVFGAGGFGFDMVRLAVTETEAFDSTQIDLAGDEAAIADFDALIDQLGARLGTTRVTRPQTIARHVPERAVVMRPLFHGEPPRQEEIPEDVTIPGAPHDRVETPPARPLRLFDRPEPVEVIAAVPDGPPLAFRWRRVLREVRAAEGPERIAPEWWSDPLAATRDYYRVEDKAGRRYWLYRDGLYDEPAEGHQAVNPAWFLHGLFA